MTITYANGQRLTAALLQQLADYTVNRPVGYIVASGAQALADNTQVAIQFSGTDDIDTDGFHNPSSNNTRITPNVAGYYSFTVFGFFQAQATPVISDVSVRKNGSTHFAPAGRYPGSTQAFSLPSVVYMEMNGTTDYIELMMLQDSAGADNTNQSVQYSSVIMWELLRPV